MWDKKPFMARGNKALQYLALNFSGSALHDYYKTSPEKTITCVGLSIIIIFKQAINIVMN